MTDQIAVLIFCYNHVLIKGWFTLDTIEDLTLHHHQLMHVLMEMHRCWSANKVLPIDKPQPSSQLVELWQDTNIGYCCSQSDHQGLIRTSLAGQPLLTQRGRKGLVNVVAFASFNGEQMSLNMPSLTTTRLGGAFCSSAWAYIAACLSIFLQLYSIAIPGGRIGKSNQFFFFLVSMCLFCAVHKIYYHRI